MPHLEFPPLAQPSVSVPGFVPHEGAEDSAMDITVEGTAAVETGSAPSAGKSAIASKITQPNRIVPSKCTPVVAHELDLENFNLLMAGHQGLYRIKCSRDEKSATISTSSHEVRAAIVSSLESLRTPSYSFEPKSERPRGFFIRGLTTTTTEQEIYDFFISSGIQVLSIQNQSSHFSRLRGIRSKFFNFFCSPDVDAKMILKINNIKNFAVKIEPFNSRKPLQCKNCQRFGHAAKNCHMPHRCVKCAQSHGFGECPLNVHGGQTPANHLKCAGCGGEHTANASVCPIRVKTSEKIKARKEKSAAAAAKIVNGVTFAQAIMSGASNAQNSSTKRPAAITPTPKPKPKKPDKANPKPEVDGKAGLDFLSKECESLFGKDVFNVIQEVAVFKKNYEKLGPAAKPSALLTFLMTIVK